MPTNKPVLSPDKIQSELPDGWQYNPEKKLIEKLFEFKGFYPTMGFVNAVAFIAQKLKHHPDMEVGFGKCLIRLTTHDSGGVTELDLESAKQIESL